MAYSYSFALVKESENSEIIPLVYSHTLILNYVF